MACSKIQFEQCKEIIKSYKCPILSEEALWFRLSEGVLVDGNKYFWLDDHARICVRLYSRALTIAWGSSTEHWAYFWEEIPNGEYVEIAKLLNVYWLDVEVEFDLRKLTVGVEYEMFFDIELTPGASGWRNPVKFEHIIPNVLVQASSKSIESHIGQGPVQIPIGSFKLPNFPIGPHCSTFKMYEHGANQLKTGLIMRGVVIKPAN